MNQIIQKNLKHSKKIAKQAKNKQLHIEFGNEIGELPYNENLAIPNAFQSKSHKDVKPPTYKLQFMISIIVTIIFLSFLFWKLYQNHSQEKIAKELLNTYQLTTLYSDVQTYKTSKTSNIQSKNIPFVIGMIKIDKIDLNYPILSNSTDELLKISICRFDGPLPNEEGNLCIAGHNYLNNRFFSRLDELKIGDEIEIYGLSGEKQEYKIFRKYEVDSNDLSCTSQDTGNTKMVTLLTCDNVNQDKRLVLQGKK